MTDSIAVLPPGWRAFDNNGAIIPLATLYFYETDGVTPLEVFSDPDLSVSLGTEVGCNSGGYPVSDADARVIIYTGSAPYNVLLKNGSGVTVWSHENVKGAVNTSGFVTAGGLVAASPVVTVASSTTRTDADAGKIINGNTTGSDITTTLPSAVTIGNGVRIGVRHGGTANRHLIASDGGDFVGLLDNSSRSSVILGHPGELMWFASNGTDWLLDSHQNSDSWYAKPIGEPFPISTNLAGVAAPPTNRMYRYILLTAGESDASEYNEGVLANEIVTGSAPLVVATAEIDDDGSPLDGVTVNLINTERRFLRAGSAGTAQNDAVQEHTHEYVRQAGSAYQTDNSGTLNCARSNTNDQQTATSGTTGRFDTETRAKNIGVTYYMRIR